MLAMPSLWKPSTQTLTVSWGDVPGMRESTWAGTRVLTPSGVALAGEPLLLAEHLFNGEECIRMILKVSSSSEIILWLSLSLSL